MSLEITTIVEGVPVVATEEGIHQDKSRVDITVVGVTTDQTEGPNEDHDGTTIVRPQ